MSDSQFQQLLEALSRMGDTATKAGGVAYQAAVERAMAVAIADVAVAAVGIGIAVGLLRFARTRDKEYDGGLTPEAALSAMFGVFALGLSLVPVYEAITYALAPRYAALHMLAGLVKP